MNQKQDNPGLVVDSQGFVCVDGVRFGRLTRDGRAIQIMDRDKRRSEARGSRFVEVPLKELEKLSQK